MQCYYLRLVCVALNCFFFELTELDDCNKIIRESLSEVRKSISIRVPVSTKEPCIIQDLERIISVIPDGWKGKHLEASLFLFAVNVGARALTCSHGIS